MKPTAKRQLLRDMAILPEGQLRAVDGLIGDDRARTYI